jgi:guanylate kinase
LDTEDVIHSRLEQSSREMENYNKYDYVLVNKRLEDSADELREIVISERKRRSDWAQRKAMMSEIEM